MDEAQMDMANQAMNDQAAGAAMAFGAGFLVVWLVLIVVLIASLWTLFSKAGKPGWAALIPIYNIIVLLEIVGRPLWWIILLFVPFVNFVVSILLNLDLAKSFGKSVVFGIFITVLPFVGLPLLAFGGSSYTGPAAKS